MGDAEDSAVEIERKMLLTETRRGLSCVVTKAGIDFEMVWEWTACDQKTVCALRGWE